MNLKQNGQKGCQNIGHQIIGFQPRLWDWTNHIVNM